MKQVYKIVVFDTELTVRSDASESQIRELADYLQKKYDEAKTISRNVPRANVMALAALHVASDLFDAQDAMQHMHRTLEARSERILQKIEKAATRDQGS